MRYSNMIDKSREEKELQSERPGFSKKEEDKSREEFAPFNREDFLAAVFSALRGWKPFLLDVLSTMIDIASCYSSFLNHSIFN